MPHSNFTVFDGWYFLQYCFCIWFIYTATVLWVKSYANEEKCKQWCQQRFASSSHHFFISYWRRDHHFTLTSKPCAGLAIGRTKALRVPSFLSYFKTLSIGPVLVAKRKPKKKFRLVRDSNSWPLPYQCSAQP